MKGFIEVPAKRSNHGADNYPLTLIAVDSIASVSTYNVRQTRITLKTSSPKSDDDIVNDVWIVQLEYSSVLQAIQQAM